MELLILGAVLLSIIAIAKVLKAKELIDGMKDVESDPISPAEIKTNALGLIVFWILLAGFFIAQIIGFNKYLLPSSASVHGEDVDTLMQLTMWIIIAVFFITQSLLFWFGFKYYFRKDRKAFWYPHNDRLEMAWTVVPATCLIALITYGMSTWDGIMNPETNEETLNIEFVSEQFAWTPRFAGADNVLGEGSFALYGSNKVGVATEAALKVRLAECQQSIKDLTVDSAKFADLVAADWNRGEDLDRVETSLKNYRANIIRLERMIADAASNPAIYKAGEDDLVINGNEIKIPVGKQIKFQFRSKDVIHSAYFPHFRAQMNTVPGMKTFFTFTPKYTSKEYAQLAEEEGKSFTGFILLCNKICGASHFNMKVHIEVVSQDEYDAWIKEQKEFKTTIAAN